MFRWDEANMASLSIDAFIQGRLALTGIDTTVHLPNLPGVIYLIAPVLAPFQSQPGAQRALIALVSILSTVTCLLCAWFVYRWTRSRAAALASAAAFALGFWAVFVGRRPWQNAFMPAFVVLFLDAVLVLAVYRRSQALVWAGVWLVVLVQLHYLAITLAPLLLAALWLARRELRLRDVVITSGLALVLLSPFLLWEVSSVNLLRDVRHAQFLAEQPSAVDASSLQMVLQLAGTAGIQPWAGPQWGQLQQTLPLPLLLGQVGVVLLLVGMAGCVARLVGESRSGQPAGGGVRARRARAAGGAAAAPCGADRVLVLLSVAAGHRHPDRLRCGLADSGAGVGRAGRLRRLLGDRDGDAARLGADASCWATSSRSDRWRRRVPPPTTPGGPTEASSRCWSARRAATRTR